MGLHLVLLISGGAYIKVFIYTTALCFFHCETNLTWNPYDQYTNIN